MITMQFDGTESLLEYCVLFIDPDHILRSDVDMLKRQKNTSDSLIEKEFTGKYHPFWHVP